MHFNSSATTLLTLISLLTNIPPGAALPTDITSLEARDTSPDPLNTLNLLPRDTTSTICTDPTCNHPTTDIQTTPGPFTTTFNITRPLRPLYHALGAHAKHRKRDWANQPPTTHAGTATQCAGETCINTAVPGYSRVAMACTHMAGRRFEAKWWTCCPDGTFAAEDGNCCLELDDATWGCKSGKRIPIAVYLVRK